VDSVITNGERPRSRGESIRTTLSRHRPIMALPLLSLILDHGQCLWGQGGRVHPPSTLVSIWLLQVARIGPYEGVLQRSR